MTDMLALVLHRDVQEALTAVELSLAEGVPSKTHVLNLLHRLVDGKVIGGPPLDIRNVQNAGKGLRSDRSGA